MAKNATDHKTELRYQTGFLCHFQKWSYFLFQSKNLVRHHSEPYCGYLICPLLGPFWSSFSGILNTVYGLLMCTFLVCSVDGLPQTLRVHLEHVKYSTVDLGLIMGNNWPRKKFQTKVITSTIYLAVLPIIVLYCHSELCRDFF